MSGAYYIVLKDAPSDFGPFVNGKALAHAESEMDRACKELGVTPLMDFFSQDPDEAVDFLEGEGVDEGEIDLPEEQ
ncbi:MAG: hypothetical protein CMO80_10840 [Verrucomicrobiales bacterium]|mgnify:CR=1 FL=1|nr:hypothetical protein [Verrucomicrobiales bacterium]|tara:strand:- start:674 stop:901 length:228 start_codon:yes stop_codon:yes gene_type:complete